MVLARHIWMHGINGFWGQMINWWTFLLSVLKGVSGSPSAWYDPYLCILPLEVCWNMCILYLKFCLYKCMSCTLIWPRPKVYYVLLFVHKQIYLWGFLLGNLGQFQSSNSSLFLFSLHECKTCFYVIRNWTWNWCFKR